jgi:hypothetical protein
MQNIRYLFCLCWLVGCQSSYEKFYVHDDSALDIVIELGADGVDPLIYSSTGDFDLDQRRMFENGYFQIGYSSFNGAIEDEDKIIQQAKKVGAQVVVVTSSFTNSVTSSIPITTNTPVTTYHQGTANSYGYGGSAYGTYSGTSTTYVPTTNYIPMTVNRYDQTAIFFRQMKPACLGFLSGEISTMERQRIGTNSGQKVAAVRIDSPIYVADIVPGDILLEIDGNKIYENKEIDVKSNQKVTLSIFRNDSIMQKEIRTGQCL